MKSSKKNTLADGLIEKTSFVLANQSHFKYKKYKENDFVFENKTTLPTKIYEI